MSAEILNATEAVPNTANPYKRDIEILGSIWRDQTQEGEEVFLLQRVVQSVVCLGLLISPATLFRWLGSKLADRTGRKTAIELYVIAKTILLALLLFKGGPSPIFRIIAIAGLIDLSVNLGGFVLLRNYWKKSASVTRSVILLGLNFFELCLEFGLLYLSSECLGSAGEIVQNPSTVFYFSVVTAATVGYGDVTPINELGRLLVATQIALSFGFVAVVLATFVGKLSPSGTRN